MVVGPDSTMIEDGTFQSLVKPIKRVSMFITMLTGITNEMLADAPQFTDVATAFFDFIHTTVIFFEEVNSKKVSQVMFVAHNGNSFDVPFLLCALERNNLGQLWNSNVLLGYTLDTLPIARACFTDPNEERKPTNNKLSTLYQFFTGEELEGNHRAQDDVKALYVVFRSKQIWNRRSFYVKYIKQLQPLPSQTTNDSDNYDDADSDNKSISSIELENNLITEEEMVTTAEVPTPVPMGDYWSIGTFQPDHCPQDLFENFFKSKNRSGNLRIGLQIPSVYANSVIKAWRLIFTNTILDKLVKNTNSYGEIHSPDVWTPIERKDLTDFFSILFLMGIQKRKDKPSNWFSNNKILESSIAKKL